MLSGSQGHQCTATKMLCASFLDQILISSIELRQPAKKSLLEMRWAKKSVIPLHDCYSTSLTRRCRATWSPSADSIVVGNMKRKVSHKPRRQDVLMYCDAHYSFESTSHLQPDYLRFCPSLLYGKESTIVLVDAAAKALLWLSQMLSCFPTPCSMLKCHFGSSRINAEAVCERECMNTRSSPKILLM